MINDNQNEAENEKKITKIVLGLDIDINIQNINFVSVWCWLYVLSNTYTTLETEFMKELKNTEAGLIRSDAHKKACITLNMLILSKTNFCGTNFPELREL